MSTEPRPETVVLGARPVPLGIAAVGVLTAVVAVVLVVASGTHVYRPWHESWVDAAVAGTYSVMGAVVLGSSSLRPGARTLAWVLLLAGVCSGAAALSTALSLAATGPSTASGVAVQVQGFIWVPGFLPLLTLIPLLYPDGLLPGRLWRWTAFASAAGIVTLTLGIGLYPETFSGPAQLAKPVTNLAVAQGLTVIAAILLVPSAVLALASLFIRFRRSRGLARRQLVILLVAAGLLAAATAAQGLLPSPTDVALQGVAAGLLPVAIGVAITRHGLYELDTAVRRALVAASLGVCLAGAYLTVFAVLQALPQHRSALSAALAAGFTGVVLQPLARRLTTGVDRMYYGDRANPYAVTSELASRLAATGLDVDRVPQVVCDTVVESLRLTGAQIRLAVGNRQRAVATAGATTIPGDASYPLRHRGETVGELRAWPRPGERGIHSRDAVVLQGVAHQVAPAVAALQLHQQLQRSREALVSAREAERLQLRRDLHDGLGATLAGLRLQVETARDLTDEPGVCDLLRSAGNGVTQAVAEVRAITDGLRPAGIDELGLARALDALANRVQTPQLRVHVDVDRELTADPAVEVALHRIAAEALANVARHAGATEATLRVHGDRHLELEISDNGIGLADGKAATSGSGLGLTSMHQRADEIGGTLEVTSHDHGTTVRATLPLTVGDLT
ncbi:MAG TPA: sensor histidine kinase [Nocardioides sp.]|nr:sensor histidine kinase [Nocardioides sp.]